MSLKDALNRANPNTLADELRTVSLGTVLGGQMAQCLYAKDPAASSSQLSTLESIVLPNDGKAWTLHRAYARVGGGTAGEMTIDAPNTTVTTTRHIAVAPNGDIVTLAADAWTSIDLVYTPMQGKEAVLGTLPVASNTLTLPTAFSNVLYLVSVTSVTGTLTGALVVLAPGGSPSSGQCALNLAKTAVSFASADAVTSAIVTLSLVPPSGGLAALLAASETET